MLPVVWLEPAEEQSAAAPILSYEATAALTIGPGAHPAVEKRERERGAFRAKHYSAFSLHFLIS